MITRSTVQPPLSVNLLQCSALQSDIQQKQVADDIIGPILDAKQRKVCLARPNSSSPKETRCLIGIWEQLVAHEGVLYRRYKDPMLATSTGCFQLVVPKSLRNDIMNEIHAGTSGGHLGIYKTFRKLKERFYWPGYWKDTSEWCRTCEACNGCKTPSPKPLAALNPISVKFPMQMVAVDFL